LAKLKLGNREISSDTLPYIIAEIGVNHEGSLDKAKDLINLAKAGGADAAKFQTYKAETLAALNSPFYWDLSMEPSTNQFQLFKKYDTFGDAEYEALAVHAQSVGIDFISTPFDSRAIDFLDSLMPFYKVASADLTNIPFLRQIAGKNKPVVLSTGASTLAEIEIAVRELMNHGATDIGLLHCILNYPTKFEEANLNMIPGLAKVFPDHVIGFSDHTLSDPTMLVLTSAYLLGARVIEKHFTYDKTVKGNDHLHSMDVNDLKKFTANLEFVHGLMGEPHKQPLKSEQTSRENARRSLVLTRAVQSGEMLDESNMTYKRPGTGISPLHWDQVLGMKAAHNLENDHILEWKDLA
jgi:sialic acid synthase SpsE